MRVLVVTDVHQPLDARIFSRQISSLLDNGQDVTYVAPWTATGSAPPTRAGLATIDIPRAAGRRRLTALIAVRRAIRREAARHHLVLVHDPEVLVALAGLRGLPTTVWDVHEDAAAALRDRAWVPGWARAALRTAIRVVERSAERRHRLILAEVAYARRFRGEHPVIRNLPLSVAENSPAPAPDRIAYVGRLSPSRGLAAMVELGRRLAPDGVRFDLIGYADADVAPDVQRAHDAGLVRWHGFTPNPIALQRVAGAGVGLSLLADYPNFRSSLPSKVAEYLAQGVPVVTTPLPEARRLVEAAKGGIVVPFADVDAAEAAIRRILDDEGLRNSMAVSGLAYARRELSWVRESARFLELLRSWAA